MFKNFLLVAVRNFLRQRFYSFINIFGLSTGLAAALFIFLWVKDEMSVDAGYKDIDRIHRIVSTLKLDDGDILTWDITPGPLADALTDNIPEVELAVRTMTNGSQLFQYGDFSMLEPGIYADSGFFKMFDFEIVKGDAGSLDRSSVAISEKAAKMLFGNEDPIGKAVKVSQTYDLEVKAVFADIERGTSMRFEYILPMDLYRLQRGQGWNWGNYDHPLYVKLHPDASPEATIAKINKFDDDRVKAIDPKSLSRGEFVIAPLKTYYLNSNWVNGKQAGGRIQYVQIFIVVAAFIVLIACINFMNMATARAVQRAKEVGVRKAVGAQRTSLIGQFIGESLLTTLLSMIAAVFVVYALLPVFNEVVSKKIVLEFSDPQFLVSCIAIVLITGLAAGGYPALFLSSYRPATVLKGTVSAGFRGASLRKVLVVFQFALTVVMIACAIVVQRQVEYIRNKNLGYDRSALLNFFARGDVRNKFEAFKTEAQRLPGVQIVSRSDNSLVNVNNQNGSVGWPGKSDTDVTFFRTVVCEPGFLEAMGLKLKEGRLFREGLADTAGFVVSERAVEVMGLANPIGTKISQWGNPGEIIGIVENFHSRSMMEAIDPIIFMPPKGWSLNRVVVKFDPERTSEVTAGLEVLSKQFAPEFPFAYTFLDDDFERLYRNEKVTGSLAIGFTGIAIIISGLGLLALAAYTAERKKKEISIRKTMGASVGAIVSLITREFARLSLVAALIGCPAAWFLTGKFLEGYAYHMDLTLDIFVITAIVVIVFSMITVIFQVLRAAIANPVDALRNE